MAGTDVLKTDNLGDMSLTLKDIIEREKATLQCLNQLGIPVIFLGGGGYSRESSQAVSLAIKELCKF